MRISTYWTFGFPPAPDITSSITAMWNTARADSGTSRANNETNSTAIRDMSDPPFEARRLPVAHWVDRGGGWLTFNRPHVLVKAGTILLKQWTRGRGIVTATGKATWVGRASIDPHDRPRPGTHAYGAGARELSIITGGKLFSSGPPSPSWKTWIVPVTESWEPRVGALERLNTVSFAWPS